MLLAPLWARAADDPWLGRDKALHFATSAGLAGGGYAAAATFSPRESTRLGTGALVALTAGVGKEIVDHYTAGHPSWRDMGWNLLGTATGLGTAWLIDRYVLRSTPPERVARRPAFPERSFDVISPAHVRK
jgi:putative lipoprotein